MQAVLLSTDLMMISAAQGAADRHGVSLAVVSDAEQVVALCDAATPLIAIDLRTPGLDVAALVPRVRRGATPQALIVACGPHVHTEALAAAAQAGCDEVITRGQFERRFDALLGALKASAAKDQE
jgi:CheY-like chemotaxis protein